MESKESIKFGLFVNFLTLIIIWIGDLYFKELLNLPPYYRVIFYIVLFLILNLILFFVLKKRDDYFSRLNIDILKERIKRCLEKYDRVPIKSVSLYNYSSKFIPGSPAKYAVLFEVSWQQEDVKESHEKNNEYESFAKATGWCAAQKDLEYFHELGIDASFADVYKETPKEDFLYEWNFFSKLSDDNFPIGVVEKGPHIVLFER